MDLIEKKKLLFEFNNSNYKFDTSRLIHQIFKDQSQATPDRIALVDGCRSITYAELDRRSDILAAKIMQQGIETDQAVGISLERGIEYTIAIIAALKSGGCYVPLDPHHPLARLELIIKTISCQVIVTNTDSSLNPLDHAGIYIDDIDWETEAVPDSYQMATCGLNDLAYILFTSGSTGEPKGVEVEHRNLLNVYHWEKREFPHDGPYNACQTASICFDASVREFWSYLPDGATLFFVPRETILQPEELVKWLCDNSIEDAFFPTPVFETILDLEWPENCALKNLYLGGDRLTRYIPPNFPCHAINFYGPAECTIESTFAVYEPGEIDGPGYPHIGHPIGNAHIYILDKNSKLAPIGQDGEIYIGGAGVGRGYANNPTLTAGSYIKNPLPDDIPDQVLYKTGDLGRFRQDGKIEFIGRNDFQVKIRGLRIELSEIEAVLNRHIDVLRSAVTVFDEGENVKFLAAYVVLKQENPDIKMELIELATDTLPDYMVPTFITVLDRMPLTKNGKIDRKKLPKPTREQINRPEHGDLTETQSIIAGIWRELLGITPGPDDNFFALGGHSLMAMQVCSRIHAATGIKLPLQTIFDHPDLSSLSKVLDESHGNSEYNCEFIKLPRDKKLYPASGFQISSWNQHQFDESGISLNIPLVVTFRGKLDYDILLKTFAWLVAEHEMLRASFCNDNGEINILMHGPFQPEIPLVDLSRLNAKEREEKLTYWRKLEGDIKFNLEKAPLWQARLIKIAEDEFKLFITLHHTIYDGWSSGVLFGELADIYEAYLSGKDLPRHNEFDYIDYVHWQNNYLDSGIRDQQLAYWRSKLSDLPPPLHLSFKREISGVKHRGDRCAINLTLEQTNSLKKLADKQEVTLYIMLQALFQLLLFKYSGQTDILTGSVSANRRHPNTEKMVGEFINPVTLRTDFSNNPVFSSLLKQLKASVIEALDNQDLPFYILNTELSRKYANHQAAFQFSLLLQNFEWNEKEFSGINMSYREIGNYTAKLDMLITFMETGSGLEGFLEYNTALYDRDDIDIFVEEFSSLIDVVCKNPDKHIDELLLAPSGNSCFILGDTALAQLCAEKVLKQKISILGVLSDDPEVKKFAHKYALPFHNLDQADIAKILGSHEFDYLFSISNGTIIKPDVLAMPRKLAINYHNSPLPRYAGMYATSWALINHETTHAISWHVMTEKVDAGDILVQKAVSIKPDDDVAMLDTKCFQAALEGFDELLEKLVTGNATRQKQNPDKRTLFGLYKRPEHAIVIDWRDNAEDIAALVKACAFNRVENFFGKVKILLNNDDFIIVSKALQVTNKKSGKPPGTIIMNESNSLTVAAGDGDIKLLEVCSLDGTHVSFDNPDMQPGAQLPELTDDIANTLDQLSRELVRNEYRVTDLLFRMTRPELPIYIDNSNETPDIREISPGSKFAASFGNSREIKAAAFAIYIAWLCRSKQTYFVINLPQPEHRFPALYSSKTPWCLELDLDNSFMENLKLAAASCKDVLNQGRFLKDAWLRHENIQQLNSFDYNIQLTDNTASVITSPGIDSNELLGGFQAFCDNAADNPKAVVLDLCNLSQSEYELQISTWNNTEAEYDTDDPYIVKFMRTVAIYPDKPAARYLDDCMTYNELNRFSSQLANCLIDRGLTPGHTVAVHSDRSPEAAAAILAVLKTGCAYLPLDSQYPPERIEFMLHDSGAKHLIWFKRDGSGCSLKLSECVKVTDLTSDRSDITKMPDTAPVISTSPDDTAYVMYTSGTTGKPKGVMISQRNLVNHNQAVIQLFELDNQTRVLQLASLNFDISVEEMFPTWLVGGELIFIPDGLLEKPSELYKYIDIEKINFLDLPTAYWHELVNLIEDMPVPESVKTVVIGGEKASIEHYRRWKENTSNIKLINSYGPTECTVIATTSEDLSCIGRPLPNYRTYVVDKFLRPVPVGCSGELMIGGLGTGQGYLNRPDLTAMKFIDSPFVKGDRLYHSGDRVKYRADGVLEFTGRIDTQIKLRGFRIEPSGIENKINQYEDIYLSKVIVINDTLTAYFTARTKDVNVNKLRDYLKAALPDYMVPTFFIQMDAMPVTPNGKIDIKSLPAPDKNIHKNKDRDSGNSELTGKIIKIMSKILSFENLGADDSFFDVGGDSLKAIRLIMAIEKKLGCKIRMEDLYHASTPRDLALIVFQDNSASAEVNQLLNSGQWSPLVPLTHTSSSRSPLFLIHSTPGDIMGYANLVNKMDPEIPVYGLQAVGLKNIKLAHHTIPEMAAFYIARIREVQPEGPYMLGGWCFGGMVAYEMAQQLVANGDKIGFLGLIETWGQPKRDFKYKLSRLNHFIKWGPAGWMQYLKYKLSSIRKHDKNIQQLDFIGQAAGESASKLEIESMKQLYRINFSAALAYTMKPYPGKIHLFMSENSVTGIIPDTEWGWHNLADIIPVIFQGDHASIMKPPYIDQMVEIFSREIMKS